MAKNDEGEEKVKDEDLEDEDVFDEDEEEEDEEDEKDVDEKDKDKAIEELRARAVKRRMRIQELKKELKKASTKEIKTKVKKELEEEKSKGLEKVDRYFLRGEGIKAEDEMKLVETIMAETGKTAEQVVELKYFQTELKELRDAKATKEATPSGSKRSGSGSGKGDVDYWLAKGGLPTDNPELAQKVVNARMKQKRSENSFSQTPVID